MQKNSRQNGTEDSKMGRIYYVTENVSIPVRTYTSFLIQEIIPLFSSIVTSDLYTELLKPPEIVEGKDDFNSDDEFHKSSDSDDSADDFLCSSNVTPDVYDVAKVSANVVFSIRITNSFSVFI